MSNGEIIKSQAFFKTLREGVGISTKLLGVLVGRDGKAIQDRTIRYWESDAHDLLPPDDAFDTLLALNGIVSRAADRMQAVNEQNAKAGGDIPPLLRCTSLASLSRYEPQLIEDLEELADIDDSNFERVALAIHSAALFRCYNSMKIAFVGISYAS